jgi:hypothetical protein
MTWYVAIGPMEAEGELYSYNVASNGKGLSDDVQRYVDAVAGSAAFQAWVGVGSAVDAAAYIFKDNVRRASFTDKFCIVYPNAGWVRIRKDLAATSWWTESRMVLGFEESVSRTALDDVVLDAIRATVDAICADLEAAGMISVWRPMEDEPSREPYQNCDRDSVRMIITVEGVDG